MIGIWETICITILLFVAVIWFGKKSPEIGKGVGKTIREFKKGISEVPKEIDKMKKELENTK